MKKEDQNTPWHPSFRNGSYYRLKDGVVFTAPMMADGDIDHEQAFPMESAYIEREMKDMCDYLCDLLNTIVTESNFE